MQEVTGDKYMYVTYYVHLVGIKEVIDYSEYGAFQYVLRDYKHVKVKVK
jgi:hypothetical protein